ncbi:tetratricopeptide repeat-containing serine protease family protein [Prochlorococcus sp. MIT 1342]|uniref:tetratricopeptide repeat-containing S1 family peptidase n=2 Tax=Prochlorococcus TaxID=1218 RepID=UPI0039B51D6C
MIVKQEGNRYTVLTAWHVVSGNRPGEEVGIYTSDGNEHQLEQGSIQRLGEVDMAVLSFSSGSAYEVAYVGDIKKVKHDQPIYVAGFPLNNSQNLRYETGEVVANAEVGIDQGYQLLYDNETVAGMSGGVLLNADGDLVGLHGRGERDEQASSGELVMKTGVNQGVPITYYKLFASGAPVVVAKTTATTADDYLAQAKASQTKKGREQTVIKLTTQALALRSSVGGYFLRAYAKDELKDYQGAIADLGKAIAINPQYSIAYNNRGIAKRKSKDYKGAIADYTKAIELDPQRAAAYNNRGIAKRKSKDYKGAIADYSKAIAINPKHAIAYNNRGVAKRKLKDYQGAIADYDKAIDVNPKYSRSYNNRGNAKYDLNNKRGACSDYKKAVSLGNQGTTQWLRSEGGAWCCNMK